MYRPDGYDYIIDTRNFGFERDYYMYSGNTNYIEGTGTQSSVVISWGKAEGPTFGYMMVWTTNPFCRTQADKDALTYGEDYSVREKGLDRQLPEGEIFRNETRTLKDEPPSKQLYFINQDLPDEQYKIELYKFLREVSD